MNATDIGSTGTPAAGLVALIRAMQANTLEQRVVKRPVLRIDSGPGTRAQYGMFFGAGVIQRALTFKHQLYPKRRLQGLFGAGLFLGGALLQVASGSHRGVFAPDEIGLCTGGFQTHPYRNPLEKETPVERLEKKTASTHDGDHTETALTPYLSVLGTRACPAPFYRYCGQCRA